MAQCLAFLNVEPPKQDIIEVVVPSGATYAPGMVVTATALSTTDPRNRSVYVAGTVADITKDELVLILNDGVYTLSNGQRPAGNPDYTQITYTAGMVVPAVRLNVNNIRIEISQGALTANTSPVVGGKLVPKNATLTLGYEAAATTTTALNYLTIVGQSTTYTGVEYLTTWLCESRVL